MNTMPFQPPAEIQQKVEQFQELVQEWVAQSQLDSELERMGKKEQDHWHGQSKYMKDISSKLNKLQRQLMRQQSGMLKSSQNCSSKTPTINSRATELQCLQQRSTLCLSQSRRANQLLKTQISSIYNAAAHQLERRQKLQHTLAQLRKSQREVEEELAQTKGCKEAVYKQIALAQAQHRFAIQSWSNCSDL